MKPTTPVLRSVLAPEFFAVPGGWARQVPFLVLTLAALGLVWFA